MSWNMTKSIIALYICIQLGNRILYNGDKNI